MMAFHHTRRTKDGAYHYRQAFNKKQQQHHGKTEHVLSLLTKDPREARKRSGVVQFLLLGGMKTVDIKKILENLQSGNSSQFEIGLMPNGKPFVKSAISREDRDLALEEIGRLDQFPNTSAPTAPSAAFVTTQQPVGGITLSQAVINYKQHRQSKKSNPDTEKERMKFLNHFEKWHKGYCTHMFPNQPSDMALAGIDRTHISSYRSSLEAAKYSVKSISKIGSYINLFFAFCQNSGFYPITNILPTTKQFSVTEQDLKNSRDAGHKEFTSEQLKNIFKIITPDTPHLHWPAVIALYSGARRQEIAALTTDCFEIFGTMQSMHLLGTKTDNADRFIPLHDQLIELGLLKYVEDLRKLNLNNKRLFPYLLRIKGQYGKRLTDDFAPILKAAGAHSTTHKTGIHSFRDTFNGALIDKGIEEQKRCEILGHKFVSVNRDHYGKEYKLSILKPFVDGVSFDLDLTHLEYKPKQHNQYLLGLQAKGKIKADVV